MMGEDPMSGEEGLRDLFAGLRREEEASAPPFFTGDTAWRQNAFERRPGWLNPSAIVAALCAAAVVAALLWQRRDPVPEPRPGGAVTSITEWGGSSSNPRPRSECRIISYPCRRIGRDALALTGQPAQTPLRNRSSTFAIFSKGGTLMKSRLPLFLLVLCCALSSPASRGQSPRPGEDPIAQSLFPPELVMQYHDEIALSETQTKSIKEAIQKAQGRFLELQWEMQSETGKLALLLKARPIDEAAVLAQLDHVLSQEREVKRAQISLLVRIKNILTDAQQTRLMELRRRQ
jgi:Spy/CpxP family protein refolding chaperone